MLFLSVTLLLALLAPSHASLTLSAASLRVTHLSSSERLTLHTLSHPSPPSTLTLSPTNTLLFTASLATPDGPSHATQAFVRVTNLDTLADTIYILPRTKNSAKLSLVPDVEARKNPSFWTSTTYAFSIIIGDSRMPSGLTYTPLSHATFSPSLPPPPPTAVFDFPSSPPLRPQPNFLPSPSPPSPEAPMYAVVAAIIALLAPAPLVGVAWARLGVFPLEVRGSAPDRLGALGFQACLVLYIAVLAAFWAGVGMAESLRACAVLALPTMWLGRRALRAGAKFDSGKEA